MQIKEAKQHIEIFEMALRSKQCLGEQELEEYKLCQSIDTVLNELEKKDKVIDEMALSMWRNDWISGIPNNLKAGIECIKEYFYKKAQK